MYAFDYSRPGSVADADAALKANPGAKLLAGGQTLIPAMKLRLASPGNIVDLGAIAALRGITRSGAGLKGIGDPHVRNRGTIGGSVANNDPAADYPAAVLALGATVHTNKRTLAAEAFLKGLFTTDLAEDEIVTAIEFPGAEKFGYAKFANPASRYALVGVAVAKTSESLRMSLSCIWLMSSRIRAVNFTPKFVLANQLKLIYNADRRDNNIHST